MRKHGNRAKPTLLGWKKADLANVATRESLASAKKLQGYDCLMLYSQSTVAHRQVIVSLLSLMMVWRIVPVTSLVVCYS